MVSHPGLNPVLALSVPRADTPINHPNDMKILVLRQNSKAQTMPDVCLLELDHIKRNGLSEHLNNIACYLAGLEHFCSGLNKNF
ncbi:hypothetical protein M8J76_010929 [Diaphorina citri]|nr:hypothetical protein M8J76_010929 [Diaphorina citri]